MNDLIIEKGRRKTFKIEYVEVTEENIAQVAEWAGGNVGGEGKDQWVLLLDKQAISTAQSKAFIGDMVVRHLELNTYKKFGKKAFHKSFENLREQEVSHDATTGQFVSKDAVEADPGGTFTQTVELPRDAGLS